MKIFLTGASGILGNDIRHQLELDNNDVCQFNSQNIKIGDFNDVKQKVFDFKPDIIIHCAAMTNVDLCEDDRDMALLTNVIGTKNLSVAANKINAKMVYISSCGVYGNGKAEPYNEYDHTNPLTFHHYTKLEGEKAAQAHNNDFLIVRPGWLFGGTINHKKNFVEARRKEAANTPVLKSAIDKKGSPTYTKDLARQILTLIKFDSNGIFNVVNEGYASRYDYVKEISHLFNLNVTVEPVSSNAFPRKANMPDNECLENKNLNLINLNQMRDWKLALKDYIETTYSL